MHEAVRFRHQSSPFSHFNIAGPRFLVDYHTMRRLRASRQKLFWQLQIGGWLTLVPFFIALGLIVFPLWSAVMNSVLRQAVGFLLTLVLAAIYRRWCWENFCLWRHGLAALALSLAATLIDLEIARLILAHLTVDLNPVGVEGLHVAASIARSLIYITWSVLFLAGRYFLELHDRDLRLSQAEVAARDAELSALRAQLNPHFLFNALNSILAEADDNPTRVKAITLNLSELLRFSLRQRDHYGRLGAEVDAIENYLKVESSRFEERLDWQLEISPAARDAVVPTSLLLPLVENAIKYGLQTSPQRLQIRGGAALHGESVNAFVENTGRWIVPDPTATRSTGIGLTNLRRRLALLCGNAARVDISFPDGRVRVDLHVPVAAPLA